MVLALFLVLVPLSQPLSITLHTESRWDDVSWSCSCSIISTIASLFTQNHDKMMFLALVLVLVPLSQPLRHSSHRITMRWCFLLLFLFLFHFLSHCITLHTDSRWDDGSCSCSCFCSIIAAIPSLFTQTLHEIQFPVPLSQSLYHSSHSPTMRWWFLLLFLFSFHYLSHCITLHTDSITMRWCFLLLFLFSFHYLNHCITLHTESQWDDGSCSCSCSCSCSIISAVVSLFTQTDDEIQFCVCSIISAIASLFTQTHDEIQFRVCSIISAIASLFTQIHDEIKFLVLILVPLSQPLHHSAHRLTMRLGQAVKVGFLLLLASGPAFTSAFIAPRESLSQASDATTPSRCNKECAHALDNCIHVLGCDDADDDDEGDEGVEDFWKEHQHVRCLEKCWNYADACNQRCLASFMTAVGEAWWRL